MTIEIRLAFNNTYFGRYFKVIYKFFKYLIYFFKQNILRTSKILYYNNKAKKPDWKAILVLKENLNFFI